MNQDLVRHFPVTLLGEITALQPVAYGMSGASVYSVTTSQGNFILCGFHGEQSTWIRTLGIHKLVAENGIAPPLSHVDEERRITVSQKIAGVSFGAAVAQAATQQAALASLTALLAKLHALPTLGLSVLNPLTFASALWQSQCQRPGFPAWALPLAARLGSVEETLAGDTRLVLVHGDLNPANILWDGCRVWLVDWDGAGLAHPYLDLATIANFLSLPDTTATTLLAMQEKTGIDLAQQTLLRACRDLARIVYGSIFLRMIPDLTQVVFTALAATTSLSHCFTRVVAGELNMASPEGQALIAAAFYKQGMT